MKCASCGMPLSPNRPQANCPKCGAPVNAHAAFSPSVQSPSSPQPMPGSGWQTGMRERAGFAPAAPGQPRWQPSGPSQPQDQNRSTRLGFLIAGLCILAGAFLLILVYFLAVGGPGGQTAGTQTTPQATVIPSPSPTSAPSPTATPFPGQQFIDNAQLSSSPPPTVQTTSTFTSNQKIYVTFDLHPNGQKGVVCFVWYLNGQQAATYNFPVNGSARSSYAYATLGGTGTGYVDLFWANDTTCSNELLAQQVPFTLTK